MLYFGNKAKEVSGLINAITFNIEKVLNDKELSKLLSIGLLKGKGGLALYYYYYSKLSNNHVYNNKASEILVEINNNFEKTGENFTFHSGIAGLGWLIEHLKRNDFIYADTNNILSEVDKYLNKIMISYYDSDYFDFLYGSLGLSLYFLKRNCSDEITNNILNQLIALKLWEKTKYKWLGSNQKIREIDLGLAHGVSGIICVLCKLYNKQKNKKRVTECITENVNFLISIANNISKSIFSFPNFLSINNSKIETISTLGWTHGDLPVGISIYLAGKTTGNKLWQNKAIEIILHTCKRKDYTEEIKGIYNISLCIGTAGIAHIYHRMYLYTGIEMFKESAIYWFDKTMALYIKQSDKIKLFTEKDKLQERVELLYGQAGVGLALISTISNIEPCWDECFLLS
ncbi:MAG: hypothetical protein A2X08_05600 [Bacteroidetes bacterium GWA2_32_17]|nr:MAG: hypothetical protein A2X08_05600 [Bacteroidetes bacterium GWA2_32_17]